MKVAPFAVPAELQSTVHVLSQMGAMVLLYDGAMTHFVNERTGDVLGYPLQRFREKAFFGSIVFPDDRHAVALRFNARVAGEVTEPAFDLRLVAASGALIEVSVSVVPVRVVGRPMFLAVAFDRSAAALEHNELQLYRSAFKTANRGLVIWTARTEDSESLEVAMSNGMLPFPLPPGSPVSALGPLAPVVASLLRRAIQSDKPQNSADIQVTVASGERRIYRAFAQSIDSLCVVLALDDITFQRQLEREVVQAQKNEQLAMLSGTIAHDFSNLLTAIHTFAELGRETLATDAESTDYFLAQIAQTAMQASQLSRNLLRFSKRESGTPRPMNVAAEVTKFEPILQALARGRNAIVIDASRTRWSVFVDPVHLEQVIVNLVGNAVDALEGMTGSVTVEVDDHVERDSAGDEGEYVRVTVRDTGSGIAPEDMARIFEPYFSRKEERGTGLGLAICRKIVQQYLGDIRVQSEVGRGTTFEVLLPRHEDAAPVGALEEDLAPLTGTERVLLVEDQDGLREVLVAFLVRLGYEATGVATAAEAMEIAVAEDGQINVLVADVELADSNGPELAGRIQERWPAVRVLFISGASHPDQIATGSAAKAAAFLPKPFTARQLAKQIRLLLAAVRNETT